MRSSLLQTDVVEKLTSRPVDARDQTWTTVVDGKRGRRNLVGRASRGLLCVLCAVLSVAVPAAPLDGQWKLELRGHHDFFFGEGRFGGGIRVPWEVDLQFLVEDGEYRIGNGKARWLSKVNSLSGPAGWFDCHLVAGTYLDSNLAMHDTPRVRFAAFPVAGAVDAGRVRLEPAYEPPGNYLAVTYECITDNPIAENWFARAELGKQVLGKRQDAEKSRSGERRVARIREVASLPPEASIELPLQDGWAFTHGTADDGRAVTYRLHHLK